ncbi:MAG TPA: hypothetical protein DDW27_01820 [Bacteroidales bacterium]|nr:hypothetical protein [Bacteroidales bacterium]
MRNLFLFIITSVFAISCIRINEPVVIDPVKLRVSPNGFFIVNEGNFGWGNGSLTYFSYDSVKTYNNFFEAVNKRPLGDVPYSMIVYGNYIYIVVNNSEKIEVIDRLSLESKATITGLISPRNIAVTGDHKAYVTSMYSDSLRILDLKTNKISGHINIKNSSEAVVVQGKKAFIANWIGGNEIFIVNTDTDQLIDSVEVGPEPESMVADKNGIIWVLCNGGWTRENFAELIGINHETNEVVKQFTFPSRMNSPLNLTRDSDGDTLFYIDEGIQCMNINSSVLPSSPFIDRGNKQFYRIGINPVNGNIVATDALDYQQNGYFMIYSGKGAFVSSHQAGIIPGNICFLVNPGHTTE